MPWLGIRRSEPKESPEYWSLRLNEARKELWKRDLDKASKLFSKIADDLKAVKPKTLQDEILLTKAETKLGLWAVNYLQNPDHRNGYKEIFDSIKPNPKHWMFVARVMGLNWDGHPDALLVFQELLKQKPTTKNAQAVLSLLKRVDYSIEAVNLLKIVVELLPEDLETTGWYCRWAIRAKLLDDTDHLSRRILKQEPNHQIANQCLGYLAEMQKNWIEAVQYYQKCREWIRIAVCHNHIGNYRDALQALGSVDEKQRNS